MIRCFVISIIIHVAVVIALVAMAFIQPPLKHIATPTKINLVLLAPAPAGGSGSQATAQTVASMTPPRPTAAPTPAGTPRAQATIVAPTPRPTPRPTAQPTQQPTPQPTAQPTIAATARPTPKPTIEIPTPRPTPPEKKVASNTEKQIVKHDRPIITPTPRATATPDATPRATPQPEPPPAQATPEPRAAQTPPPAVSLGSQSQTPPATNQNPPVTSTGPGNISVGAGGGMDRLGQTYFMTVLNKLQENFKPPYAPPGVVCRVKFTIMKDGSLTNIKIVQSTGNDVLNQSAIEAVMNTQRVPPLYDGIQENYLDVVVDFNYERKS